MFKSLNAMHNILLAKNNQTIPRDKNLLADVNNYVCFINDSSSPFGFEVTLENKQEIPHKFVVYLKDANGQVLCSGSDAHANQVKLVPDVQIRSMYAHPTDDLVLEMASLNGDPIFTQHLKLKIYYLPVKKESTLLYRKGMPVEVLDEFNKIYQTSNQAAPNGNVDAPTYTVAQIVSSAHLYTPPNYDVWNGASYFGNYSNWNAITFHCTAYMQAHANLPNSILNCYDCAAALQVMLRADEYPNHYCYMRPYGYMALTSLIGRGQCNNPFYGDNVGVKVIDRMSANRTGFANHAFIRIDSNSNIVDSCAGPHTGGENIDQYIASAIDTTHYVPARCNTGTSASVGYYTGVTTVDMVYPVTSNNYSDKITEGVFNMENLQSSHFSSQKVIPNIPAIESVLNKAGWKTSYSETVPGHQEALQILFFTKGDHVFFLKIFASRENNTYPVNRLFDIAFNTQSIDHGLSKVKASPYHQHMERVAEGKQESIFQHYNLVVHAYTSDGKVNLSDFTKLFADALNHSLVSSGQPEEVKVNLSFSKTTGQYRLDLLEADKDDVLEFMDLNNNIRVIACSPQHLVFEKAEDKKTSLQVWAVNTTNLGIKESKVIPVK